MLFGQLYGRRVKPLGVKLLILSVIAEFLCLVFMPVSVRAEAAIESTIIEKPSPGVWPDKVFTWYYNPSDAPAWLDADQAYNLVKRSAKAWQICGVQLQYKGETAALPGKIDRHNVVGWSLAMPKTLRGLTMGQAKHGTLLERDILIRPDRNEFRRFPRLLQKVITHEFGHALGITHSTRCDDVMTLASSCPRAHPKTLPLQLTATDLTRCRAIYPN
jgi:hypothetical protein